MKLKYTPLTIGITASLTIVSNAALTAWQGEVGMGTSAEFTKFTTTSAPSEVNVGTLTGARTFEFIVNADTTGASSALLGDSEAGGPRQAVKFEQYNNTGNYGVTTFGVADANSGAAATTNTDIHLAFVFDGTDTTIYENGALVATMSGTTLTLTGSVGLGGIRSGAGTFAPGDVLDGDILGFASYDSALTGAEILAHSNAFAAAPVPEPSSTALIGLGGIALILRRRK